jgi:pimeloyl-[acyl-carrier protein] methyl ester esterase
MPELISATDDHSAATVRAAEARLFDALRVTAEERTIAPGGLGARLRVLDYGGTGPPVLCVHGLGMSSAAWAPLAAHARGLRLLAVDLPGHGLSEPFDYSGVDLRAHARDLLEGLVEQLDVPNAPVAGNSIGAMMPLWRAADPEGWSPTAVIALGEPAVAFADARARFPLWVLATQGLGRAVLRAPAPGAAHRAVLGLALGRGALRAAPPALGEALHAAARRRGHAATAASLVRRVHRLRWPQPGNPLSEAELGRIRARCLFVWGDSDRFLAPDRGAHCVAQIPGARLEVVRGGHAPWLDQPERCGELLTGWTAAAGAPG